MRLKIFVPDYKQRKKNPSLVPLLQPFYRNNFSFEERISKFGEWIKQIELVDTIKQCDIVVPAYYVNFYYANSLKKELLQINKLAYSTYKLTVCWTNGDWGITPNLSNFHLYRYSGYLSRNPGNQFCCPYFYNIDPLPTFYNGILPLHLSKPKTPIIGFCGRASKNQFNSIVDISKNIARKGLKFINLRHEDFEKYYGSSFKRSQMLSMLEKSNLVETNFIKLKKYAGGADIAGLDKELSRIFFQNMKESHYIFCFRGWGNFSHRLYETMSAGRIPIIISSDNNIPFSDKINWNIFPIINLKDAKYIDEKVACFHSNIEEEAFVNLQLKARKIWEDYLQYKGFMNKIVDQYLVNIIR
jgi:hypothetical protein